MNYTDSSIRYMFKNLWYIILLSVLPGVCLSAMACMGKSFDLTYNFYYNFFTGRTGDITWMQIFTAFSIYNFTDWLSALFNLVAYLAVVLCASMFLALVDKHMRIGKRTLNGIVEKLNDNVISTCAVTFFFSLIYEVWAVIFASLAFGIFAIPNAVVQYLLFAILLLGGGLVLLYAIVLFYLWLPCMQITGFRAFESLRYSNQITEQVKRRLIASMALSVVVGNIFIIPAVLFLHDYPVLVWTVMLVVYMFFFMLFIVRMEIAYFDAAQLNREDLNDRYN